MELVPQAHGGALLRGGTPEMSAKGGRAAAEKRRARAERSEAVDDAMVGHVEKMSKVIEQLVEEAGGEQYRCPQCGSFGPKVSDYRSAGGQKPSPTMRLRHQPHILYRNKGRTVRSIHHSTRVQRRSCPFRS